jgi:hypothetical protein
MQDMSYLNTSVNHFHSDRRAINIPIWVAIIFCLGLIGIGVKIGDEIGYSRGLKVNQAQLAPAIKSAIYADIEHTVKRFGNFTIPGYKVQVAKYTRVDEH